MYPTSNIHDSPNVKIYESIREKLTGVHSIREIALIDALIKKYGTSEDLKNFERKLSSPPSLYLKETAEKTKCEESVTLILGKGGSKRAFQLSKGRALLIPNMEVDAMCAIQKRWPRVVEEEIRMSLFIQKIGLLGLQLQKVWVSPERDSMDCIPALVTDSFESLSKENIYIIDWKNCESSTWKGDHKLFANFEDAKNPENWGPIIGLLAKDIAKLVFYNLPLAGDSFNIAIVRIPDGDKIRYFGFDYTRKLNAIKIPALGKITSSQINKSEEELLIGINTAFNHALECVLFQESPTLSCFESLELRTKLSEVYSKNILQEVYALQEAILQEALQRL